MSGSSAQYTLRSTRVLLPDGIRPADVHVRDGRIDGVTPRTSNGDACRDLGSLLLMPGLVDPHVHVNEPGRTEWEGFATASAAAAAGGITTIVDMPLNSVPATTDVPALERKREAARAAMVNVEFWGGVVPGNAGDLDALADAGVRGFKCFLSPSGVDEFAFVEEPDLRAALRVLEHRRCPLLAHAEWPAALKPIPATSDPRAYATWLDSRPPAAEVDAIAMLISLCREFRTPIHIVHLAAAEAVPML